MAKAIQEFYFDGVFYEDGADVPDEVAAQVSSTVVDSQPEVDTSAYDGDEAFEAAVDARVEAALAAAGSEAVENAVSEAREREQAAFDALVDGETEYDPSGDGVTAKDVHDYLSGLDRDTVAGSYEYDRVVAAEQAGDNRSTAIPAEPSDD